MGRLVLNYVTGFLGMPVCCKQDGRSNIKECPQPPQRIPPNHIDTAGEAPPSPEQIAALEQNIVNRNKEPHAEFADLTHSDEECNGQ